MTMNDAWGFESNDHNWKSLETLIRNLVDIASKGGNYLLNEGPTFEGQIPAPSVERLEARGDRPLAHRVQPECQDQTVSSNFVATGSWMSYKTVPVGKLKIDQAGSMIIKLVPGKLKGFAVMNLRTVVLKPEAPEVEKRRSYTGDPEQ